MVKTKSTKRALLTSALSLLLCVSMLIGTTFAWFTDSVTSGRNTIQSGNLDVELWYSVYKDGAWTTYAEVTENTKVFDYDLWEPGYTAVAKFKVVNAGSLALKYHLTADVFTETPGVNVAGETFLLSKSLKYGLIDADLVTSREAAAAAATKDFGSFELDAYSLPAGSNAEVGMVITMPTTVGNEANHNGKDVPKIEFGINLVATQATAESDSFDDQYDVNAPWMGGVNTDWYFEDPTATEFTLDSAADLAGLAALVNGTASAPATTFAMRSSAATQDSFKGKTIKLAADVDLSNIAWTPIGSTKNGFHGTFDGQGNTVYNLKVTAENGAGLFGYALYGGNVKNLNVENAVVKANDYAGAIMGRGYTDIDNCHVKDVTVMTTPYLNKDGIYDGGAKAGGIIGQLLEGAGNTVTNCSATDVKIYGFRDLGGVVGMVHNNNSASGNTAKGVTIGYLLFDKITEDENENAGAIYGRVQSSATVSPAKDSAENKDFTLVYAVYDVNSLLSLSHYVNNGINTFAQQTVVLLDDINLLNVEWEPIGVGEVNGDWIGFNGSFDGQGHTISNIKVTKKGGWNGLFGLVGRGTSRYTEVISNVNIDNVVIEDANRMSGALVGQMYGNIENCHVNNVTITAVPNATASGGYDNGDKIGGIVGWLGDNGNNHYIKGCTATNVTLKAYRDVGGITGYIGSSTIVENCAVNAVSITVDQITNSYGEKDANAGAVVGRIYKEPVTIQNNTEENCVINIVANNNASLVEAIKSGADKVTLGAGEYTFPSSSITEPITIVCEEGTVFEGKSSLDINGATVVGATFAATGNTAVSGTINGVFKDCVFEGSEALRWCYSEAGETVVFENCVIKTNFRGVHFDTMDGDVVFKNCEINGFNAIGGAGTVTFEKCTFGYDKSSYNGLNMYSNINLIDCTFNYVSGKTNFIDMEGTGKTLTIENCKATLDGVETPVNNFVGGSKLAQNTVIYK